ncbi:MAG: hypothetical protein ACYDEH_11915 [Acidimicrobiales bacterium]
MGGHRRGHGGCSPSEELASGTLNAARQVGGAIGIALLGTLVAHRATFVGGLRITSPVAGGAFVLAAVLTVIFIDRPIGSGRR